MTPVAKKVREDILHCSRESGHGHIPTCFSIVELLLAVYSTMRHRPQDPKWQERDIFILSKGHAALGYYCVLAEAGYFDVGEVETFGGCGSRFGCHVDRLKVPGGEVSTGSLGHGIGVAVGMALAFKIQESQRKVYTIIGDGESNEGTVWESLMAASNLGLDNLTVLFDNNDSQKRCLPVSNPAAKFKAFGCAVEEVDGHNLEQLKSALDIPSKIPKTIVANTVKGFGCKTLVDEVYAWHRRSPKDDEYIQLMEELNAQTI